MENPLPISFINDFIFCPASIYFHNLYQGIDTMMYQTDDQINGSHAHAAIEEGRYSSRKHIVQALHVYSDQYNLIGKIDIFDNQTGLLTERKRKVTTIYDGYVFQLYAQYVCMREMGYSVKKLKIYSMSDNKGYMIPLPSEDPEMEAKFLQTISDMHAFVLDDYHQTNKSKCMRCIYEPACDRSLL
jgi:CRISPR-associated exonuclease Cas4